MRYVKPRNGIGLCAPPSRRLRITSYSDVVRDYIRRKRNDAAAELAFFRQQPSLVKAIHYAARSITPCGKRHPHQRRRPANTLAVAERRRKLNIVTGGLHCQRDESF
jgi:hypothetical protein